MHAVGAWLAPWAPYGRRGDVAGPIGLGRPPWGRGRSAGPPVVAVGAWPAPWAPYGRLGGVAGPLGHVWPRRGVAGPLGPLRLPWGRGPAPRPRTAAMGACREPRGVFRTVSDSLGHLNQHVPIRPVVPLPFLRHFESSPSNSDTLKNSLIRMDGPFRTQ